MRIFEIKPILLLLSRLSLQTFFDTYKLQMVQSMQEKSQFNWTAPYFPSNAKLDPSLHSVGDWAHVWRVWSHLQTQFPHSQVALVPFFLFSAPLISLLFPFSFPFTFPPCGLSNQKTRRTKTCTGKFASWRASNRTSFLRNVCSRVIMTNHFPIRKALLPN